MSEPLVWLPFDPSELGEAPAGLRYEVVDPTVHVPDTVGEVEFYVTPYSLKPDVAQVLPAMTSLQVVQVLSAGVDAVRAAVPAGVRLCNGRGIHDTSTAELALTLVLAAQRDIPGFVRAQDQARWDKRWRPALADSTVLLVGHGSIGHAIEARLAPFETTVVKVARTARDGVHGIDELPALLPQADVVILIVPLTDETRGLLGPAELALLRDDALVVNLARGPVIDTAALLAELASGRLRAALDVYDAEPVPPDSPLWSAPGLLMTPHVGGWTSAMWPRAHRLVSDQLHRFAAGEELANVMSGAY